MATIQVKQEPRGDDSSDETRRLEAELEALFGSGDDEEEPVATPTKRAPQTAQQRAEEEARRRRALQKQRSSQMRARKRLICDCYEDQAIKRARVHVKTVEEAASSLSEVLPPPSDLNTKGVNERINQTRLRLRKVEKLARELKNELREIKRVAGNGVARGNTLAMKIACIVAKRSDINMVTRNGKSLKMTQYDDFASISYRPNPRGRRK
jgi:hypothetical protein